MATKRFSIEALFKLVDKWSTPLAGMSKNTNQFSRAIRTDFAKAQRAVQNFTKSLKQKLGRAVTRVFQIGLLALSVGLGLAAKEFVEFDQTIVGATARFKDLEIGTAETAERMLELKKTARDVAKVTQFTAVESAAALNFFAKAGFESAEAMDALKTQTDLATVSELDLARTSDITSDLLGSLGLNAEVSAEKIKNLSDLSNSLGIASNMANVTLETMFETLKIAGPIATKAGEKMNPLIAITAALGSAGIKGTQAATAIKNSYLNLAKNAPKVKDALADIGLAQADFVDQETGTLNMVKAMKLIGDATKDLPKVEQVAIFDKIFGKNAVAGAINMSDKLGEIDKIFNALEGDKKIADIADEIRKGLGMQLKILQSGLLELGFKFIEAFEKDGAGALESLIKVVQDFDPTPIISFLKTVIQIAGALFKFLKTFAPVILTVIAAFLIYNTVLTVLAATHAILNAVMTANPIGLVIVGIALLIAAIILLIQNWDLVIEVLGGVWNWFNKLLDNPLIATALLVFAPFIAVPAMIIKHWEPIKQFFTDLFKFLIEGFEEIISFFDTIKEFTGDIAQIGTDIGANISMAPGNNREQIQAPVSSAERAAIKKEEFINRNELLIKDETGRAEISKNPNNNNFKFKLSQSGGF